MEQVIIVHKGPDLRRQSPSRAGRVIFSAALLAFVSRLCHANEPCALWRKMYLGGAVMIPILGSGE